MATNRWIDNYYVGADGLYRPSQWIKSNGKWWYRYQDGSYVASGFDTIDGKTYFFDPDGYMITGWARINEKYYYFNQSGHMVTNAWVDDCYLESDGVLYVVDAKNADKRRVKMAINDLKRNGGNVIGLVMNKVDMSDEKRYGYGYGYGEENDGKKE